MWQRLAFIAALVLIAAGCGGTSFAPPPGGNPSAATVKTTAKAGARILPNYRVPLTEQGAETVARRLVEMGCHTRVLAATCRPARKWSCTVHSASGTTTFAMPNSWVLCT
jgi:hypothetical protein